jgi:serine protease AprX
MGTLSRKAVWGAALALWVIIPASTASAADGSSKIDKLLQQATSGSPQPVIVRTRPGAKDRVKGKLPNRGRGPAEHKIISGFSAEMDRREIAALKHDPDILSISTDADVTGLASPNRSSSSTTTKTTTTPASDGTTVSTLKKVLGVEDWFTGSSMTVAVIDSGVQAGADFTGRIVGSFDFTTGRGAVRVMPTDGYGHGTHVAGLIGSSGAASLGKYAGVAPGIKILSLKVLDKEGSGKTSNVIAALEYAIATKDLYGTRIVNLSLGHPIFESAATDPLVQAVEAAVRSGLIVVVAAGNYGTNPQTGLQGYAGIASPGNAPSAITVGASNTAGTVSRADDRVATFSSRGPSWYDGLAKPDVVAPGFNLISNEVDGSTLAVDHPALVVTENGGRFLKLNGSSMATGVVSGLIAVLIESNNHGAYTRWQDIQATLKRNQRTAFPGVPALTPNAIKAMLQYTATPLRNADGVVYDALTQGTGEVNGLGALALAYYADTTKSSGTFWLASSLSPSTTFAGVEQPWAQTVIWGRRMVRGASLIEINQLAWDDNLVWGTDEMDNLVWGTVDEDDNLVWGTSLDDDNLVWGTSLFSGDALLDEDNLVWGTSIDWDDNLVWGTNLLGVFDGENLVWGTTLRDDGDNLVWGTLDDDNLVWGTSANRVVVLGTSIGGGL